MPPTATAQTNATIKAVPPRAAFPTREQGLAEGHLVDVSEAARKAGFHCPVAMTRAAFEDCVAWSEQDTARQKFQNSQIRLQSVLFMAYAAGSERRQGGPTSSLSFDLLRIPRDGNSRHAKRSHLRLVAGRDSHGEAVLTILLPNES